VGCTGRAVLRWAAGNLTPLIQPAADGSSSWRGRIETHKIGRQMKHHSWTDNLPICRKLLCSDTLIRSEFE